MAETSEGMNERMEAGRCWTGIGHRRGSFFSDKVMVASDLEFPSNIRELPGVNCRSGPAPVSRLQY